MGGLGYYCAAACMGILDGGQEMINGWLVLAIVGVIMALTGLATWQLSKTPDLSWRYWRDR